MDELLLSADAFVSLQTTERAQRKYLSLLKHGEKNLTQSCYLCYKRSKYHCSTTETQKSLTVGYKIFSSSYAC